MADKKEVKEQPKKTPAAKKPVEKGDREAPWRERFPQK